MKRASRKPEATPKAPTSHFGKNVVLVVALVAVGFFSAWLRFRNYLGTESSFTDGVHTYDTGDSGSVRYAVWDAPARLPESINSGASESRPALSPDGRWMVFAVGERGLNSELYVAEMIDGQPVDAKPLASLNTSADESAPAFSSDALYFASDRKGGSGGLDLYRASYANGEFGAAERLGDEINSESDDCDPAPQPKTHELVFASNRGRAGFGLFVATLDPEEGHPTVQALATLDAPGDEREPAFTADGRTLFFASNRKSGTDDFDLYRSSARGATWSPPVALDGLNTPQSERAPLPTFDDFSLYFARGSRADDGSLAFDLWSARSVELFRMPGRPVGWLDLAILGSLLVLVILVWVAKRWPRMEVIYRCYLVSIVLHLLVLWLARGWFTEGGWPSGERSGSGSSSEGDTDHFSLDLRGSIASRGSGGGDGPAERSGLGGESGPSKSFSASLGDGEEGASSLELAAPMQVAAPMPSAGGGGVEIGPSPSAVASTPVALMDRSGIERRGGAAPGLRLDGAATSGLRSGRVLGGPERRPGVEGGTSSDVPSGAAVVGAPIAGADAPPARTNGSIGPMPTGGPTGAPGGAIGGTASIALAAPQAERASTGGGGSTGLSLDALAEPKGASTRGGRAISDEPERRGAGARTGAGTGDSLASPSSGAIAALVPSAPRDAGPRGSSASSDGPPGPGGPGGAGGTISLHDAEASPKGRGTGSGAGDGPKSDLLDSLAGTPTGSARERTVDAVPARFRGAREQSDSSVAPQALALETHEDRGQHEPPRPGKSLENTPYKNRAGEDKSRALSMNGGTRETEVAVAKGLAYLARIQRDTGGWGDHEAFDGKYGQVAVGKTGLALLAFLGAGHTHFSQTEYSENAARALAFLMALQDPESGHFGDSDAYSHGIATYALAECYALTGEQQLREPLERAVAHILAKQNHTRDPKRFGGWSYYYANDRVYDRWPRTSITVWQLMALESARLAGLTVPEKAFDDATTFIDNAEDPDQGWYRYNHDPNRLNSAWPTLPASTPAALFALSLVGRDVNSPQFDKARDFVLSRAPRDYRRGSDDEFVQRGQGNLYFWYYGTLSMFRAGGNAWQRWNAAMKECLVRGQRADGSWAPIDVYCNYARDDEHDRSYSTAMCVLSLEVYYRYYLPLLKVR
ncbi:MAG TPA: prenyltransferase/squalene oxidase repeat-containing protein [Planctomycetota bacterium]|nr:prenyltransferase/squalene oxidase repeat-containing protein [Planctomycetota bacterium]